MSCALTSAAEAGLIASRVRRSSSVREGLLEIPERFELHHGGVLAGVRVAWRLAGATRGPVVAVLGGISAGREVFGAAGDHGWWNAMVGPGRAVDTDRLGVLGIDFLGGSGLTTGPQPGAAGFPCVSSFDQAALLERVLAHLDIARLHAIVGASYGGMVGLAFAERYPQRVARLVVMSAADRAHPLATAWRSVERRIVRHALARRDGAAGLEIARALAMVTYRTGREFEQRFAAEAEVGPAGAVFPVESYLFARGADYARSYVPEAFVCLSESIDLHCVDPAHIGTPTTLVAIAEDQLVPLADLRRLARRLAGPVELIELESLYGHDAFLKEVDLLTPVFQRALALAESSHD